ncbi:hypothetical protein [Paenibacillus koleovorans]|nr:hypothetical protein [Paenibacillus koleovorans]
MGTEAKDDFSITCDSCGKRNGGDNPVGQHWLCQDCRVSETEQTKEQE